MSLLESCVSVFSPQKIKELTYMHSEGILSGELKHGPLAMIDKDMPCIMIITHDNTYTVRIYREREREREREERERERERERKRKRGVRESERERERERE